MEENADALRSRYLAWIYELGELHIKGTRLVEHMQLRSNFSYWWMTLLVEKCNFSKSPHIDDAIRLLAFKDWVEGRSFTKIILSSANKPLAECLDGWTGKMGVSFEWKRLVKPLGQLSWLRRGYALLPAVVQAWLWLLKYLSERWVLSGEGVESWRKSAGHITFFSYLFNLKSESAINGKYESNYWGPLPELLRSEGRSTRWLHLYVKSALLNDSQKAVDIVRSFNAKGQGDEVHVTLDSFLSLSIVFQAIKDWIWLAWKGRYLNEFILDDSKKIIDLWPLHAEDWCNSTRGATAMANVVYSNLLHAALKDLPKQNISFYLQENQGWEFALIQHWKLAELGSLVGVPHSLVRYWDLRYFFDHRSYFSDSGKSMPLPDFVAVNGQSARNAYLQGGYLANQLVQVEALRYLYLHKFNSKPVAGEDAKNSGLSMLVLGDYQASNTRLQMRLLADAAEKFPIGTKIIVKPHPACPIIIEDYPQLSFTLTVEPLENLLGICDVAYTSSVTSAAVDAYCAGVAVISVADPASMNLSPLRGLSDAHFASTSIELIEMLNIVLSTKKKMRIAPYFFNIDNQLILWRRLLAR